MIKINKCCIKFHLDKVTKNMITSEYICKNCGTVIMYNPFNDGNELLINQSGVNKISSDRVGKESTFAKNLDLYTQISDRGNKKSFKFHVVSKISIFSQMMLKIEKVGQILGFKKIVIEKAFELFQLYNKIISIKNKLTLASSLLYVSCELNKINISIVDLVNQIPSLKKKLFLKGVREIKTIIDKNHKEGAFSVLSMTEKIILESKTFLSWTKNQIIFSRKLSNFIDEIILNTRSVQKLWKLRKLHTLSIACITIVYILTNIPSSLNIKFKKEYFKVKLYFKDD